MYTHRDMSSSSQKLPVTDSLEKVAAEVRGCPKCKLSRTRKNAVPGEGQLSAKVMFVGEAPGRSEDEKGRPFVGAAGRILDEMLAKAGISRSQVFITNVVKCRPPNNRVPEDDEVQACIPYLERQIALIRPRIICILGRTAYSSILGGGSITANRGKIIEKAGQKYFLTIHPAAAIYNKSMLSLLEADLKKLAKEIGAGSKAGGKRSESLEDFM
ncbi:uracil-DNA glycosylase, family 4 [Candidatus Nitrososphaera evergladensis SR1]|uniref:Type-4 uracil-DNA glycosylase n=1 Tax=Candidatus Nitrososphaera evergladensis SR1 TaxID=1459636 RepID=A0A075MQY2_9ARCH|nr:uracil-DNA glycosylase [Candidatus Nitrososphaera evergladensis]AIF83623.1 uracil-DNA glycosylase, family 4 [Candidatus Nitrososphaera evergladensis SR1]